jgi:hypothetical protein
MPPRSEPQKSQALRPRATPLIPRSAALLTGMVLAAPPRWLKAEAHIRMSYRDRGAGSTKRWQAVLSMSCELELLRGRPYDLPGCAVSANP